MENIKLEVGKNTIPFLIGCDCFQDIASYISNFENDKIFIFTDTKVKDLYANKFADILNVTFGINTIIIIMEEGEISKNAKTVYKSIEEFFHFGVTRSSILLTLGGGVVGNTGGLIASLLFRGIRLMHFPTTLLSIHDSVTSIKQAVNYKLTMKNTIGTYYYPTVIFTDLHVLKTLPDNHLKSGVFELIKNGLILGGDHLDFLYDFLPEYKNADMATLEKAIKLGIEAKQSLLRIDPFEKNEAIIFEYGHTVGHAIELASNGLLSHGESVGLGIKCAALVSNKMNYLSYGDYITHNNLINLIDDYSLSDIPFSTDNLLELIMNDNKKGYIDTNNGKIPMILLREIGKTVGDSNSRYLTLVPLLLLRDSIEEIFSNNRILER